MDIFSHIFGVKICNVCLKRPKINEKEAGVGPFFLKKYLCTDELQTCENCYTFNRKLLSTRSQNWINQT